MRHDLLADALTTIKNADRIGKKECVVKASKLVKSVLQIMKENGYIEDFEYVEDGRGGKIIVRLKGRIIETKAIKPRYPVGIKEFEKFEKRYLPSREKGILIISTSKGILDHKKAIEMNVGGRLLAYVY